MGVLPSPGRLRPGENPDPAMRNNAFVKLSGRDAVAPIRDTSYTARVGSTMRMIHHPTNTMTQRPKDNTSFLEALLRNANAVYLRTPRAGGR